MTDNGYKLVSFSQDWGRMGSLEGLFVCDGTEWRSLQLLIKHEVDIYFGEVLGKHSDCTGPVKANEISVRSENQEFCAEFRRLKLDTGFSPLGHFDPAVFWEQSFNDNGDNKGKNWPPNEDGTFNWSGNG